MAGARSFETGKDMAHKKENTEKLENRILHLKSSFPNYNIVRMREALRYLSGPKLELFINIPFYIHVNLKEFPGFIESDTIAHGIYCFEQSGFYNEVLKQRLLKGNVLPYHQTKDPCVQGFYHIGSLGTFTQSAGSDFDYWVIIDKKKFSEQRYYNLEKKLDQILKFSREAYDQEVTFFIMDQEEIQKNCYARFNDPETLTAPKVFLKEEFYRTFLMGRAYKALGDAQKSEECLQVAAEIYMDTDKLGSAEDILNEILEAGTNSLNVFNTLGVLHRKKGDVEQALRQYKKALKVHPDEPYIYYNIGRLYLDMKNTTKAKVYFQAALDKDHGFEEAKQVIKAIDLGLV